jgi:hypothetical protein
MYERNCCKGVGGTDIFKRNKKMNMITNDARFNSELPSKHGGVDMLPSMETQLQVWCT